MQIKILYFPSQMNGLDLELFLQVQLMPLWWGIFFAFYMMHVWVMEIIL